MPLIVKSLPTSRKPFILIEHRHTLVTPYSLRHTSFLIVYSQVHLSFSQLGGAADGNEKTHIGGSFLNLLLQSVGIAVTEGQDLEFK